MLQRSGAEVPLSTDPRPWTRCGQGATYLFLHPLCLNTFTRFTFIPPRDQLLPQFFSQRSHLIVLHFFISLRTINAPPFGPRNIICLPRNPLCVLCEFPPQAQLVPCHLRCVLLPLPQLHHSFIAYRPFSKCYCHPGIFPLLTELLNRRGCGCLRIIPFRSCRVR